MNKVAQYYRELVASLSERLRNGERDIDALVEQARQRVYADRGVNANRGGRTYPGRQT